MSRMLRNHSSARHTRKFRPGQAFGSDDITLERRFIPGPAWQLVQPNPGISSTVAGSGVPGSSQPDTSNGPMNADLSTGSSDPGSWGDPNSAEASWTGGATNQVIGPSSNPGDFMNNLTVNVNLMNQWSVTAPDNPATIWGMPGIASNAQSGPSGAPAAGISYALVDDSNSNTPSYSSTQTVAVTVNIEGYFSFNPDAGGFVTPPTGIFFNSAATGITVVGPVLDGATGDTGAVVITYPDPNPQPGEGLLANVFDGVFDGSGGSFAFTETVIVPSSTVETITYAANLVSGFTTNATGAGSATLHFHFDESVSAGPY